MRMILAVLILLIGSFLSWWFWYPVLSQPKPVAITIPDSRISNLELKVKNLENWECALK